MRIGPFIVLLQLTSCSSLWNTFDQPNSGSCQNGGTECASGYFCDLANKQCFLLNSGLAFSSVSVSVGKEPRSLVVGDFNHDGLLDVAVANSGESTVRVQLGDGFFGLTRGSLSIPVDSNPNSLTAGDFDQDGYCDLAIAYKNSTYVSVLVNDKKGSFLKDAAVSIGSSTSSVAAGQLDGDQKLDLIGNLNIYSGEGGVYFVPGNGAGGFGQVQSRTSSLVPSQVALGDFNGDAKMDVAGVQEHSNFGKVFWGDQTGNFSFGPDLLFSGFSLNGALAMGHFHRDTIWDLAITSTMLNNSVNSISIFLGDGIGGFAPPTSYPTGMQPDAVAVGDFNGDNKQDLVIANFGENTLSVMLGDGMGRFSAVAPLTVPGHPTSVAVEDFDGDGKPDIVVADDTDQVTLLTNRK